MRGWTFGHFCLKSGYCRVRNTKTKLRRCFLLSVDSPGNDASNLLVLLNLAKKLMKFFQDMMFGLYLFKPKSHLFKKAIKIWLNPTDFIEKCKGEFPRSLAWNLLSNPYSYKKKNEIWWKSPLIVRLLSLFLYWWQLWIFTNLSFAISRIRD